MAMTVREQLTEQVSRPRPRLESTCTSLTRPGARKVLTLPLDREITLTARMLDPSPLRKLIRVGAVNAAEVCGIPAHHLLITGFRIDPLDLSSMTDISNCVVTVELLDSPCPLRGGPEVDLDALLDALDGKAGAAPPDVPPDQPKTWHDLPGLL
jgi:hypothetical protein